MGRKMRGYIAQKKDPLQTFVKGQEGQRPSHGFPQSLMKGWAREVTFPK